MTSADPRSGRAGAETRADGDARSAMHAAEEAVNTYAAAGRDAGASAVHDVAAAAHGFADQMEDRQPELAAYARRAADRVDGVAEAIRTRPVGDLVRAVDDFARREPVAFFGVALLAGFAVSRFVGASGRRAADETVAERMGGFPDGDGLDRGFDAQAERHSGASPLGAGIAPTADVAGSPARPGPAAAGPAGGSERARHTDSGAGLTTPVGEAGPATPQSATAPVQPERPAVATRAASAGTAPGETRRPAGPDTKH